MRFRLVKTGKSYAEVDECVTSAEAEVIIGTGTESVPPVIWETGNASQIRSLLVLREAELLLAKSQLTGDRYSDWYVHNQIRDLETKIADLKRWLNEAMAKDSNRGD